MVTGCSCPVTQASASQEQPAHLRHSGGRGTILPHMARVCQVSGKKGNGAMHIRHRHSGAWKFRAPKKHRVQLPNLQTVTIPTKHGKVRLTVAASVLKSEEMAAVLSGLKPIPKAWLKKPTY